MGLTTDMWKDEHKQNSYLSCTAHWITDCDCSLQQSVLFCEKFVPSIKSGENIRNEMLKYLLVFDISSDTIKQSITFVTDRGANMIKAFKVFTWIPCSCHLLNTILYHGFRMKPDDIAQLTREEEEIFLCRQ